MCRKFVRDWGRARRDSDIGSAAVPLVGMGAIMPELLEAAPSLKGKGVAAGADTTFSCPFAAQLLDAVRRD